MFIHISHNTYHPLEIISTAKISLFPIPNIQMYFPVLIKHTINTLLVTNILIPVIILWFCTTSYKCYRSLFSASLRYFCEMVYVKQGLANYGLNLA